MKPHISIFRGHLSDRHPEWKYRCESYTLEGFLHLAFGATHREAYEKWLSNPPYTPEPIRRRKEKKSG